MFGLFRTKPRDDGNIVVDLRLDRTTTPQAKAITAFGEWASQLVGTQCFRLEIDKGDGINYTISLLREDDKPEWLRCRVEARLHVEEDQRNNRVLGRGCSLLVDCRRLQDETGPEISFESPFTAKAIEVAMMRTAAFLSKVK